MKENMQRDEYVQSDRCRMVWKRLLALVLVVVMLPLGIPQRAQAAVVCDTIAVGATYGQYTSLENATIDVIADQQYTGYEIRPTVVVRLGNMVLRENVDYTLQYANNINVGTATVIIVGINSNTNGYLYGYVGSKTANFNIVSYLAPTMMSQATITAIPAQTYTGYQICPKLTVMMNGTLLWEGTDYTVQYVNNINVGTATVVVTGMGKYAGAATATFQIVQNGGSNAYGWSIDPISTQTYTGYEIRPYVVVRMNGTILRENIDYYVQYSNNINIGTAYVTVIGTGNYSGTCSTTFQIASYGYSTGTKSIYSASVSPISAQTYTGNQICPSVNVWMNGTYLYEGTDYTVYYSNNINMGTATVTINGIGQYTGTRTITFQIVGPGIASATIASSPDQLYTGSEIRPNVTVTVNNTTLRLNTDYTVSYTNNRNIGTATVTVTGRGNYTGSQKAYFKIVAKDLANATVSSIDTQRYTGGAICPNVTVKIGTVVLQKNVDYTLTYSNNTEPGTASITISGKGTFTGTKVLTFKIAEASLSSAEVTVSDKTYNGDELMPEVEVSLNGEILEQDEDYEVEYRNNVKPGKATVVIKGCGEYSGSTKEYFVIKPKKMVWKSARADGNAAVLSWKKDSYVSGYELYRSKKKSSGYSRVGTLTKKTYTSCRNTKLSKGTYYYKVRSYVVVDGKKYYSKFSSVKKVVIK